MSAMSEALIRTNSYTEEDYYSLPEHIHAELVYGQFYFMAPPSRFHQEILMELSGTIRNDIKSKKGSCKVYPAPFAVKLFAEDTTNTTIVEPDISVICDPKKLTNRGCSGAPDWIIEIISPSTASHDYVRKLNIYLNAGVKEYWIVDPRTEKIFVYPLEEADLKIENYTFRDKIKVNIYDDLWIDFSEISLS